MYGPRWRVKSPLAAIALSHAGVVALLGAAAGVQLFLAYEVSVWESAAERFPASVEYFGVRVEKFGSAVEPEEQGDVKYAMYYHWTFR